MKGGKHFRTVERNCFDAKERLKDMEKSGNMRLLWRLLVDEAPLFMPDNIFLGPLVIQACIHYHIFC